MVQKMPNVPPLPIVPEWDDESIPSSAKALTRKKTQAQTRYVTPIDDVLGVCIASLAIAFTLVGIINLINLQRERILEDEENRDKSEDDEVVRGIDGRRCFARCRRRRRKENR